MLKSLYMYYTPIVLLIALLLIPIALCEQDNSSLILNKDVSTAGDRVKVVLEVRNVGEFDAYDVEIHEYYAPDFYPSSPVLITYNGENYTYPVIAHEERALIAKTSYFIVLLPISKIRSRESVRLEYWLRASKGGNFLVPNSIVWYSYGQGHGSIRKYVYSENRFVSIPTEFEKTFILIYPYLLSTIVSVTVFYGLRSITFYFRRSCSKSR